MNRVQMMRPWRLLLAAVAGVTACGESPSAPAPTAQIVSVTVGAATLPSVARLAIELSAPAAIEVAYWAAATPRLRVQAESAGTQDVFLYRLIPGAIYAYEVRIVGSDDHGGDPARGKFETDTLPSALAAVGLAARGEPTIPLTMLSLNATVDSGWFTVVDEDGSVVWYRQAGGRAGAVTVLPNGNFVLQDFANGLTALTPDGRVVGALPQQFIVGPNGPGTGTRIHHDVIATSDNTVLYLARDEVVINDTTWVGEEIWEWNPETGAHAMRWNAWDFLTPTEDFGPRTMPADWLHANSLTTGPRGNILVSFHFLDQIVSISSDYQSFEWRLGGPRSTITVEAGARFSGQHTAAEISPGRVLMFDNGFDREDGSRYSRALELELDVAGGTARSVWEFRPQPDNYARIISSARRLANGNTLVGFGTSAGVAGLATGPIEVYEVTQDGLVLWHLRVDGAWGSYRATPLSTLGGESVVPTSGGPSSEPPTALLAAPLPPHRPRS